MEQTVSYNLIEFIKKEEGYRDTAYYDNGQYAIGYGHRDKTIRPGQRTNPQEAEQWLRDDLKSAESCIKRNIPHSLTQGQYDALVSLAYNYGCAGFLRTDGGKYAKSGDMGKVAEWLANYKNEKNKGLEKRRQNELAFFLGKNPQSSKTAIASNDSGTKPQASSMEKTVLGITIVGGIVTIVYTLISIFKSVKK